MTEIVDSKARDAEPQHTSNQNASQINDAVHVGKNVGVSVDSKRVGN